MSEVTICQCLWPTVISKTITGHSPTCPVEQAEVRENIKAFFAVVRESELPETTKGRILANEMGG